MSLNEVTTVTVSQSVPPQVTDFLSNYHAQGDKLTKALKIIDDQDHLIKTLEDQNNSYRKVIEEISAKSDYYMRLAVEMRTHFSAFQAMTREAEKCFTTGPYRNNGSVPKEALQVVADDINANTEVKDIPGFLTDDTRKERLEDLKGEPVVVTPKMPKGKAWPANNGANK